MRPAMTEPALRKAICNAGAVLYARGLIGPTDGNLSARLRDGLEKTYAWIEAQVRRNA